MGPDVQGKSGCYTSETSEHVLLNEGEREMAASIGARATWNRYFGALVYPDFRNLWAANLSAQAAAWALIVSRGWLVYEQTGSSLWVGLITFAAKAPQFLVPPFAGVLADRFDRKAILRMTYAVNLLHNIVLAGLALTGTLTLWELVILSVVNGTARAVQMPTSQALAANLVPREKLLNALSLNSATQHGSRLVGPGLATPLLAIFGPPAAFVLCTAFYAVGLFQINRIKTVSTGGVRKGESFFQSFQKGIAYAWSEPLIRMVLAMVIFHCGLTMAFETLIPTFAVRQLNAGVTGFSTIMIGVGAGALVGSLYIGGIQSALVRGRLFLVMGLLSGLGQVLLAFMPNMAMAVIAAVIMGGSQAAFMNVGQAVTQSLAKDEFRGRIASINTFSLGGVMAGMELFNGYMGSYYSASHILWVNGAIFVGIMVASVAIALPRSVYVKGLPDRAVMGGSQ